MRYYRYRCASTSATLKLFSALVASLALPPSAMMSHGCCCSSTTLQLLYVSSSASELARCPLPATVRCLSSENVKLGFHVRDARAVNRRITSVTSESSPARRGVGSGFGHGSCVKDEAGQGLGFRFRVPIARREVRRVCLGRMDFSVELESDHEDQAFGVVGLAKVEEEVYRDAVRALGRGHVLAVPTDTVYGLACDASSGDAIRRVYEIKGRKLSSPLAVCVADVDVVCAYVETTHLPTGLLDSLLPGAVTLLLPRRESGVLSASLNPGVGSIGIRIPDCDFVRGLSRSFGVPLALTSANTSSHASTVKIDEFEHLWPHCAFVFDAGSLRGGRAGSTIVDLTQEGVFKVVRPGSVLQKTKETLARFGLQDISS